MWRTIGASVRGTSHITTEVRCQDYHSSIMGPDFLLLGIADGAGSAISSYHGAKASVDFALNYLNLNIPQNQYTLSELMRRCFYESQKHVFEIAAEYQHPAKDYASTLLIVIATSDKTVGGQIGDGVIIINDGQLRPLTWPQQGEYANVTNFLIQKNAMEKVDIVEATASKQIALLSDGLQGLALQYDSRTAFAPFFNPFFTYLQTSLKPEKIMEAELTSFLDSRSINERTDDDKSLLLAIHK